MLDIYRSGKVLVSSLSLFSAISSSQEVTISVCLCELEITTVGFSNLEEILTFQQKYS